MVLEYGKCRETSIIIIFQPISCLKGSLVTLPPPEAARLAGPLVGGPHGAVHGVRAAGPVINVAPPPTGEVKLLAVTTSPVQMGDTLALTCTCNNIKENLETYTLDQSVRIDGWRIFVFLPLNLFESVTYSVLPGLIASFLFFNFSSKILHAW